MNAACFAAIESVATWATSSLAIFGGSTNNPAAPAYQTPWQEEYATTIYNRSDIIIGLANAALAAGSMPAFSLADRSSHLIPAVRGHLNCLVSTAWRMVVAFGGSSPGAKGDTGDPGPQGIQGAAGAQGGKGDAGATGAKGDQGANGAPGTQGVQGTQGLAGAAGAKGDTGLQGPKGDSGSAGANGTNGAQGIQGVKGDTGTQGIQGIQGIKGDTGAAGATGTAGSTGAKGDTGAQGATGLTGATGTAGTNGTNGTNATTTSNATTSVAGLMSAADKTKLDGLPAARVFNNNVSTRTIQTVAAAGNGWQIDATRDAEVGYSVGISTTISLSGNASGYVALEIAATNSATAANWTEIDRVTSGQSGSLVIGLTLTQSAGGSVRGWVPAGWYARMRSVNTAGTPTYAVNSGQEVKV